MSDITIPVSTDDIAALTYDADAAKREVRADHRTRAFWDRIVVGYSADHKRAAIIRAVLEAAGLWSDKPQRVDGERTAFGNVVQRFGARYDAALKRACPDETTTPDWLRLVRQAAENAANKGEFSPERIVAEVWSVLSENTDSADQAA